MVYNMFESLEGEERIRRREGGYERSEA